MKCHFLLIFAILPLCLQSQVRTDFLEAYNSLTEFQDPFQLIFPPSFNENCSDFVQEELLPSTFPSRGYKAGMSFGLVQEWEKAQFFSVDLDTTYYISEVHVFFSKVAVLDSGPVRVRIYSHLPGEKRPRGGPIGISEPILVSDLRTDSQNLQATVFSFSLPVELSDPSFIVSVDFADLYQSEDTVSIFSTSDEGNCEESDDNWSWRFSSTTGSFDWENMTDLYDFQGDLAVGVVISLDPSCACPLSIPYDISVVPPSCSLQNGSLGFVVPSNSPEIFLYQWNDGSTSRSLDNLGPGTYSVLVKNIISPCCSEFSWTLMDTVGLSIKEIQAFGEVCEGSEDGKLVVKLEGGQAPFTYELLNETSSTSVRGSQKSSQSTLENNTLPAGEYTLLIQDSVGCLVDSGPVSIPRLSTDSIIHIQGIPDSIGMGTYPLRFSSSLLDSTFSYFWRFGLENTSMEPEPSFTMKAGEKLLVELTANNGVCELLADTLVNLSPGILPSLLAHHRISWGPNPAVSDVLFYFTLENAGKVQVSIWTLDGKKLVDSGEVNLPSGFQYISLPISAISPGIYAVQVTIDGKKQGLYEYTSGLLEGVKRKPGYPFKLRVN